MNLTIDVNAGRVCFDITDAIGTPNRGLIHFAPPGANGGIVVPLFELGAVPTDPRNDELQNGRIEDCVAADPAVPAATSPAPICTTSISTTLAFRAARSAAIEQ